MLGVVSLGSSSRGCALLLLTEKSRILLDAGVGVQKFKQRCYRRGVLPEVTHILLTHGHSDHINAAPSLVKEYGAHVYATQATLSSKAGQRLKRIARGSLSWFRVGSGFEVGDTFVQTFKVPHDESCVGFLVHYKGMTLCYMTDFGVVTNEIRDRVSGVDALVIESNYDEALLRQAAYPRPVKRRIFKPTGHLSNREASDLMAFLNEEERGKNLKLVLAGHLSGQANDPRIVVRSLMDGWSRGTGKFPLPQIIEALPRKKSSALFILTPTRVSRRERGTRKKLMKKGTKD